MPKHTFTHHSVLTIRPATLEDHAEVARLAQLDSAPVPTGDLMLAVVDGTPMAAISLSSGAVIADPFTRTVDLVAVLRERASRLQVASTHRAAGRHDWRPTGSPRWLALLHR